MRKALFRSSRTLIGVAFLVLATAFFWVGCSDEPESITSPAQSTYQEGSLGKLAQDIERVMAIQDRHTDRLMRIDGVVGTATGLSENGDVVVKIFAVREGVRNLPAALDGIRVEVEVTGEFKALKGGGGSGVSHKARQTPPIQLGTSGGWRYDLANGFCCGGTLGSLVSKGGKQYILSNYHVFESDIVSGGNERVAAEGEPVIQPGLIDVGCKEENAQNVATLSGIKSLPDFNVDAAIAEVISGMVSLTGEILEVGTISSQTVAASLNQAVKKSGRTTGLTRSKVAGLNATVSVRYDNECAGGVAFTKTFTDQIIVNNKGSKFIAGGDSGSLMTEDVATNPRSVGLLYAGSSLYAVANPIGEVLNFLGATMVGN